MKNIPRLFLSTAICGFCFIQSCEKESIQREGPVAFAGRDTVVDLPQEDGIVLDGSMSRFHAGEQGSYSWSKISGPTTVEINFRLTPRAIVRFLSAGTYLFELRVADKQGVKDRDTVQISVNHFPAGYEILFSDLTWRYYTDPDGFEESVLLQTTKRPDLFHPGFGTVNGSRYPEVYLKDELSSDWILIKPTEQFDLNLPDRFYYHLYANAINVSPYPTDRQWIGRKAAIKIKF